MLFVYEIGLHCILRENPAGGLRIVRSREIMQGRMGTVSLHLDNTIEHDRHIWIINSIKEINCTLNTLLLPLD